MELGEKFSSALDIMGWAIQNYVLLGVIDIVL